jgi:DNA-binding CsgD family transcriptional regulator
MDNANEQDYRGWLEFTADALECLTCLPVPALMERLAESFEGHVAFNEVRADGSTYVEYRGDIPLRADVLEWWQRAGAAHHPLVQWFAVTGSTEAQSLGRVPTEIMSARQYAPLREHIVGTGLQQQLSIPCRVGASGIWAFVLGRADADYDDATLARARRIQPLLELLARQGSLGVTSPRSSSLTARETAVLHLLISGLTAEGIARRLGTSPRTVHKHLEHVYRKLGVTDRLGAYRVAQAAGLLAGRAR